MSKDIANLKELTNEVVDNINIVNPNLENIKIKKYLDNFTTLKIDINNLLNTKTPVWFVLQLKNIKDKFFVHLENLIDYIEGEFVAIENSDLSKSKVLKDLWIQSIDSSYVSQKLDRKEWIDKRVNYRVDLRNDEAKSDSYKLMDWFNQFRNIILNIQNSLFSDFYKVYILRLLSDKLTLKESVYNNFKFFMLFILPKNYLEYCKIYTFFIEYEWYKNNNFSVLKLSIISYVLFSSIILFLFFNVSIILTIWIIIFYMWYRLRKNNFLNKKPKVRFHLSLNTFWLAIILFYCFVYLWNNWFFELKIDLLDKINNQEIVWQKADINYFYDNSQLMIADLLQNTKISDK